MANMQSMTDEELDRDWKPSGRRPQSTIARSFSQELMDIFRIENSVADLDEQVDKRKQQVDAQTSELEALEARIKEMEKRLKQPHPTPSAAQQQRQAAAPAPGSSGSPRAQRTPLTNAFSDAPPPPIEKDYPAGSGSPAQQRTGGSDKYGGSAGSRPGTARQQQHMQHQQPVPGALPPTPTASEDGDEDDD